MAARKKKKGRKKAASRKKTKPRRSVAVLEKALKACRASKKPKKAKKCSCPTEKKNHLRNAVERYGANTVRFGQRSIRPAANDARKTLVSPSIDWN